MSVGAIGWLQNSLRLDVTGEWNRVLHLSVSGSIFTCSRKLFQPYIEIPFFQKLLNDEIKCDEDGSTVIDRDGNTFRHILNFMRNGKLLLPDGYDEWELLLEEVAYYGLVTMDTAIRNDDRFKRREWKKALPTSIYMVWKDVAAPPGTTTPGDASATQAKTHPLVQMVPMTVPHLEVQESGHGIHYQHRPVGSLNECVFILLSAYNMKVARWETTPEGEHHVFFTLEN